MDVNIEICSWIRLLKSIWNGIDSGRW
jgi:hypothetical protein